MSLSPSGSPIGTPGGAQPLRVLMISLNRADVPAVVMPLGACMVAQAARDAGHRVRFIDFMFEEDPSRRIEEELARAVPDVVGISLRNIDNNDLRHPVAYYRSLAPVMDILRAKSTALTVLGGAAVGIMPEELLRASGAHFAVAGNGERSFPALLDALAARQDVRHIPGLVWMERGVFRNNPPDRDFVPSCRVPDFDLWVDTRAYRRRYATMPLQTKRGCPYRCVYCTYGITEGSFYRLCSPEAVARTVAERAAQGYRDIEFVDNVFNAPLDHAMALCRALERERSRARLWPRLHTIELNPAFVTDELLAAMEAAGFVGAGITAESACDPVLAGLGKDYRSDDVMNCAAAVRRHRLPVFWMFLLGGPGETKESVAETLHFARTQIRPRDVAFFNIGIRIYPGTLLENRAREEGVLKLPPSEMLEPVTYISPAVDRVWLEQTLRAAVEGTMRFIDSEALGSPLLPPLYRYASRIGLRPPLWKHTARLRRGLRLLGAQV